MYSNESFIGGTVKVPYGQSIKEDKKQLSVISLDLPSETELNTPELTSIKRPGNVSSGGMANVFRKYSGGAADDDIDFGNTTINRINGEMVGGAEDEEDDQFGGRDTINYIMNGGAKDDEDEEDNFARVARGLTGGSEFEEEGDQQVSNDMDGGAPKNKKLITFEDLKDSLAHAAKYGNDSSDSDDDKLSDSDEYKLFNSGQNSDDDDDDVENILQSNATSSSRKSDEKIEKEFNKMTAVYRRRADDSSEITASDSDGDYSDSPSISARMLGIRKY